MAMVVNHNIPALSTYNVINSTSNALQKSINKLSTGLRINSAADDAAGLAISEKMRAQVRGLDQAVSNSQDGISMIQTAEGALSETHSILQRMRELSVQAANDTLTQQDRGYIQEEVDQLREEITRIGNTTQFNKKKLLNGDAAALWSSDNLETKAVIKGGLRTIDQFGQKNSAEGNYKITVKATPGQGEVQKTDIMRLKHDVSPWYATTSSVYGIATSDKQKSPDIKGGGTYNISGTVIADGEGDVDASARLVAHSGGAGTMNVDSTDAALANNYSLKFTVDSVDTTNDKVTFSYSGTKIGKDGKVSADEVKGTLTLDATGGNKLVDLESGLGVTFSQLTAGDAAKFKKGEEFVFNVNAQAKEGEDSIVSVDGTAKNSKNDAVAEHKFTINNSDMTNSTAEFKVAYTETDSTDPDYNEIQEGSVYLTTNKKFADNVKSGDWATFRKDVTIPNDPDPSWLTATHSSIDEATVSSNMPKGDGAYYSVSAAAKTATGTAGDGIVKTLNGSGTALNGKFTSDASNTMEGSGYVQLEVTARTRDSSAPASDSITFKATFWGTDKDGNAVKGETANVTLAYASELSSSTAKALTVGGVKLGQIKLADADLDNITNGEKFYFSVQADSQDNSTALTLSGAGKDGVEVLDANAPKYVVGTAASEATLVTAFAADGKTDANGDIDYSKLNWDAATSNDFGEVTLKSKTTLEDGAGKTLATMTWGADKTAKINTSIGEVAGSNNKLYDLEKFWDSQGKFMLDDPQTLTITQGDGKQASVTLYKDDTLGDVAKKLNNAIANDLGQGKYVDDATRFVTYVDKGTDDNTSESVKGTMLIRTVVPGSNGTISISGDEDIINALSLNTIQKATESKYTVNIEDAHTGKKVVSDAKITGNKLIGALNPNVDVEFDAMAGIKAEWDNDKKAFKSSSEDYTTYLHLSDNTTVFQIGANEGEDMGINIGDMRSHALGLDSVLVTDRESAARSITVIDNAIDKVSSQRAKLGAYQNRLEHTINNLTVASENLTSAESRIRDTDMAKEMMNFSKLQIMLQAGNSMLAQANQLPQNVLSLVR